AAKRPRAVLVAIQLPGVTDDELRGSLGELSRLVTTLGYEVVARSSQRRRALDGGTVVGEGKLAELAGLTRGPGAAKDDDDDAVEREPVQKQADVIVVDHDLTPMQFRNLATATAAEILDRSGVIVEIFHRHASSREARLQVELARLSYVAPRFRAS